MAKDNLFELIQSMSKSEKRYFKLNSSTHSDKENSYVKMFDVINTQKNYNEKEVKEKLKNSIKVKNFAVEKNYLYNFLLKSLTSFHGQKSLNAKASNSLYTIRLLISKALYTQAKKLIDKNEKFAEQSENFTLLLELLKLKIDYLESILDNEKIRDTYTRIFEVQSILNNVIQYRFLHNQVYEILTNLGKKPISQLIDETKKIFESELLQSIDLALCVESKIRYHESWALYFYLQSDYKSAFKHSEKTIELTDKNGLFKTEKQNDYISNLNNYIIFSSANRDFDKANEKINILKSLTTKDTTNRDNINIFSSTTSAESFNFITTNQYKKIYDVIEEYENGFTLFGDKMLLSRKYGLFLNISILYFINEEFNLALKWTNKIINSEEPSTRTDMLGYAWLYNVVIHYELKNHDYLDYLMKSTLRYLSNKNQLIETSQAIITLIKVLISSPKLDEKEKALKTCLKKLTSESCEKETMDSDLELKLWVKSKIENKTYASLLIAHNNSLDKQV